MPQVSVLLTGLQALPHLQQLAIKVWCTSDFSLSATLLADVQLPQLERFSLDLYNLGNVPLVDLSWLGCARRSFVSESDLDVGQGPEVFGDLKAALHAGVSLALHVDGEVCAEDTAVLTSLGLRQLELVDETLDVGD